MPQRLGGRQPQYGGDSRISPHPSPAWLPAFAPRFEKIPRAAPALPTAPAPQLHNPLHGLTLEAILTALVAHFGWAELAERIPIRCFASNPSMNSSLKFLRKTPWAREKVEGLYGFMLRDVRRTTTGDQAPLD